MDVSYEENFCDGDTSSDDEVRSPEPKRRCIANRVWLLRETFDSSKEAEDAIESRKIWSKSASRKTTSGLRFEYRCTADKYRVNECPASVYLLYHSTNASVSLYETSDEHANPVDDPTRGLSNELKTFVEEKYREEPKTILHAIQQRNMTEPQNQNSLTFLATLRITKYGKSTVSASDIRTWCEGRSSSPDDVGEP